MRYELTSHNLFYRLLKPIFLCRHSLQEQDCLLHSRGYSVFSRVNQVISSAAGQKYTYRILACSREYTFISAILWYREGQVWMSPLLKGNIDCVDCFSTWIVGFFGPQGVWKLPTLCYYCGTYSQNLHYSSMLIGVGFPGALGKFQTGNIIHLTHLQFCLPFRNNYLDHLKASKNFTSRQSRLSFSQHTTALHTCYSTAGFPGICEGISIQKSTHNAMTENQDKKKKKGKS